MAASNQRFPAAYLFRTLIPVANGGQVADGENDGDDMGNRQVSRGRNGGAGDGQGWRRHSPGRGRGAAGSQRGGNRGNRGRHSNNNWRTVSSDRNAVFGSRESLPGSRFVSRDRSATGNARQAAGGDARGRFDRRHGNGNGADARPWQRDGEDGQRTGADDVQSGARKQTLGFKRLEELATKDPGDILVVLANSTSGFDDLLAGNLRPDLMILVLRVLAKACNATFVSVKVTVLSNACSRHFVDQLINHVGLLPNDGNVKRKAALNGFVEDLYVFCNAALTLLPAHAADVFPQLFCTLEGALRGVMRLQGIPMEDKLKKFEELQKLCFTAKKECDRNVSKAGEVMMYQDPPNNYREVSLYPSHDDLFLEDGETSFIRPNIVKGSYASVEHYLDVQFRLLREDFIKPLREGIQEYVMSKSDKARRFGSVRFYPKVKFLGTKAVNNSVGSLVCFDPDKRMRNVKWEFCRRFMFGSLLCFSKDNFQSVLFAKVLDRNLKDLKAGIILVDFCGKSEQQMDGCDYKMIESEVYFEPYFHVMQALQNMTEDSFPMSQYIVQVQPHTALPAYLRRGEVSYQVDRYMFPVQSVRAWPSPSQLNLDDSQYEAFRSALTKEFVVIQGPPGTGKTFLGLKVATVLLQNVESWNRPHTPILVVCFTNHALDQFLEGLLDTTKNLVRVGGQSKNENLQKFSLKEKRNSCKRTRQLSSLMRNQYAKMSQLMRQIKSIQKDVEIVTRNEGVISIKTLVNVPSIRQNCDIFMEKGVPRNSLLLNWLLSDKDDFGKVDRRGERVMNAQHPPQELPGHDGDEDDDDLEDGVDLVSEDGGVFDDDIDFMIDPTSIVPDIDMVLDLPGLESEINKLQSEMNSQEETIDSEVAVFNRRWVLEDKLEDLMLLSEYLKVRLQQPQPEAQVAKQLAASRNLSLLDSNQRWVVYHHWVGLLREVLMSESGRLGEQFRTEMKNMQEVRMMDDLEVLKDAHVIGMTTTGAARLQPLLQALKPKIVIIEEAAEVMESHIVVSLTRDCQHLVLIGDHQQLRPSTADYDLARKFYFDISLFERMISNGMHCETLKVQHRMRPEIAQLIVPSIYPELYNHPSVREYDSVLGVDKSLFFLTHKFPEDKVEDSASRKNSHEGDFVIALCRYLLMQGYTSDQITVLATYSGQMFYLRNERKKYEMLRDVKMTVVDNFQGEESDIILLSLVRSNAEANIGFLRIQNRVCVALSRAKKGLFIIGNMDNLTQSSEIWQKIKSSLEQQKSLGDALTLRCQVHPNQCCQVRTAKDFTKNVPEGGCMQACLVLMKCGHECQSVCHIQDREHVFMKCLQDCNRSPEKCQSYHKCPKRCWEDCGDCRVVVERQLPCGHAARLMCHVDHLTYKCPMVVHVTLPHCGHVADKPCHRDPATFPCPSPCEERLPCGHSCELSCHVRKDPEHLENIVARLARAGKCVCSVQYKCRKPCAKTYEGCSMDHKCAKRCHEACGACTVPVKRQLECGHTHKVACSQDPGTVECRRGCSRTMDCGHKCKKLCFEPCGGCQEKVRKATAGCGHLQSCKCCEQPDPLKCTGPCVKRLPCGHACAGRCCDQCGKKPCMELVRSPVQPLCNHPVQLPCHVVTRGLLVDAEELLQYCQQPCGATLQCGHRCKGSCGECLQGRIHLPCGEKCGRVLICGHSCEIPCADSCPPCNKKCTYRCKHSVCPRKCGQPCIQCMEPCELGCVHQQCTRRCHEACNITPCTRPCKELLACGHPCIGYCGDPCPPLCRVCNKDEVCEVFFGDEDEDDARFVYLEDCKHTVLGEGLQTWLQDRQSEISMKGCPRCKTPIMRTQRYADMVKAAYQDVVKVKEKVFGDLKAIEASREQLKERLRALDPALFSSNPVIAGSKCYQEVYNKLSSHLLQSVQYRPNMLSTVDTTTIRFQIDVLTELATEARGALPVTSLPQQGVLCKQLDALLRAVARTDGKTSAQQVDDVNSELLRFKRLVQLLALEHVMRSTGRENAGARRGCERVRALVGAKRKYARAMDEKARALLEGVNRALKGGLRISDAERKQILAAVGVSQGHWFKCPNGHVYVITECGGAMEEGTCNECGERIGGRRHALLATNSLATEMDGAHFAAWSDQRNMANYDFDFVD